jgi:hypothetical protein
MQKAEIEAKINELRGELETVKGTTTEVYTRIVGYYRSVKNWNAGKREEYGIRKLFTVPASEDQPTKAKKAVAVKVEGPVLGKAQAYMLFERDTCPNCPPVKDFMRELSMDGTRLNVDTEEGLNAARRYGVMASPTVIFFDESSNEVFRAHNVADLKAKLPAVRA